MTNPFDIAVIGAGVAGLTAVQHALLAGRSVVHLLGMEPIGGLVCNIGELQGYPSGAEPVSGLDLAIGMLSSNAHGVAEVPADAISVAHDADGFRIAHNNGELNAELNSELKGELRAKTVIAATGARLRMLDVPGVRALEGRGVSQCGWCDGPLYQDKHVVVVGGGDAALEEASHLAQFTAHVTLLTRGDRLHARQSYIDRVRAHGSIEVRLQCDVIEITGTDQVSAIRIIDRNSGTTEDLACSGVFVFIGLEPNSAMFAQFASLESNGGIVTDDAMQTRTPGLYAIGAVRSGYGGRVVHAVGDGATAAMAAAEHCQV